MAIKNDRKKVLGIDPGNAGCFVLTDGQSFKSWPMPLIINGKEKSIDFGKVHELFLKLVREHPGLHVFIERAVPMAMGSKHAFNYGRGFAALEIALLLVEATTTYVEPNKWTKEMHEGVSTDLKAKAKSIIAVKRLYPKLVQYIPTGRKGKIMEGPIDALLIAGYGLRKGTPQSVKPIQKESEDFY